MAAIPEEHLEFCRQVAALAKAHNLERVGVKFLPGYSDAWSDEISMNWEQGRHGDDSGRVWVESTVRIRADVVPNACGEPGLTEPGKD